MIAAIKFFNVVRRYDLLVVVIVEAVTARTFADRYFFGFGNVNDAKRFSYRIRDRDRVHVDRILAACHFRCSYLALRQSFTDATPG
jgi:hypothetical protein